MHQVVVPRNAEQKGNTGETGISEGSSPKYILAWFHGWISCFYFFLLFLFLESVRGRSVRRAGRLVR